MASNDEKPSTSKTSTEASKEETTTFHNLMKRLYRAQTGVKNLEAAYKKFMVTFGDFEKKSEILPKKGERLENKSADEIIQVLLSEPPLPTPPSSPEPQHISDSSQSEKSKSDPDCQKLEDKENATTDNSKIIAITCETDNSDQDCQNVSNKENISIETVGELQEYPKKTDNKVILGPNGTEIGLQAYNDINWTSAAGATRQLLGFVFTNDILATHTLTGKPSPAFYGRERPDKMQLDPNKIVDIIFCIRTIKKCTEREIRAAITTKCSDTSKKYKRHSQKELKSVNSC